MTTILYSAELLFPAFITKEDINDTDTNKQFFVINGYWYGTFNNGFVTVHNPYDKDRLYEYKLKCYQFEYDKNIPYENKFIEFKKLIKTGKI